MKRHLSLLIVFIFVCRLSAQNDVPNGNFEISDLSPTHAINWVSEGGPSFCGIDNKAPYQGRYSMKISSTSASGMYFVTQDFPFASKEVKRYKLKCAYRTKKLRGKAALGARVFDKKGNIIMHTLFTISERRNQGWKTGEGVFYSDETADMLRVFGNITGSGEVWFDEIIIEEFPFTSEKPDPRIGKYINSYFDIVNTHSIIRDKETINRIKDNTLKLCAGFSEIEDCHDVLKKYTTRKLRDGHSFFSTPKDWKELTVKGKHPGGMILHNLPSGRMLKEHIAYLEIPTFVSMNKEKIAEYVDSIQNLIARLDAQNPKGWIIDLGKNGGGNSFAMLAGLGPLVGNGICGYSFSGDGTTRSRIHNEGWTGWDSVLVLRKANSYHLKNTGLPIAVIYGSNTGSSGEVTAIDFIGLPNTKSFGQQTSGANTRIDNFRLSDGSYLNLASGLNADRTGKAYDGRIKPDVETVDTETAIAEAVKWILGYAG